MKALSIVLVVVIVVLSFRTAQAFSDKAMYCDAEGYDVYEKTYSIGEKIWACPSCSVERVVTQKKDQHTIIMTFKAERVYAQCSRKNDRHIFICPQGVWMLLVAKTDEYICANPNNS